MLQSCRGSWGLQLWVILFLIGSTAVFGQQTEHNALLVALDQTVAKEYPSINSLVVAKASTILFEKYYNNCSSETLFPLNSVTKTITALALGRCIQQGVIGSEFDALDRYLKDYPVTLPHQTITIEHLLTMTDGKDYRENFNSLIGTKDLVEYFFNLKQQYPAGQHFRYSSVNSQVLSKIITLVSGQSEAAFVQAFLFSPLKIKDYFWNHDERGITYGGFGLNLRSQDLLKIGYLLLNQGRYCGESLIPSWWVSKMTTKKNQGGSPHGEAYGYHCWVSQVKGYEAFFAGGRGGQFLYVIPKLQGVIVITSEMDIHHEENRNIITDHIVNLLEKW